MTIAGTGFQSGATVRFGGTSCTSLTVVSASQITCSTPAKALGAVNIVIQNPDVQSGTLTSGFTYTAPPTYSSLRSSFSTARCSGCHGTQAGFSTEIYSQITTVLVAGSPSTSKLYIRVANNTMPGGTPLTDAQKIAVYEWILDGAPNN